jgi:DNA replication protein DnaC
MEIEVAERASRRIQRHRDQSDAPAGKTFASFDFDAAPGVRKQHLLALGAGGDWINNGDNLLLPANLIVAVQAPMVRAPISNKQMAL